MTIFEIPAAQDEVLQAVKAKAAQLAVVPTAPATRAGETDEEVLPVLPDEEPTPPVAPPLREAAAQTKPTLGGFLDALFSGKENN